MCPNLFSGFPVSRAKIAEQITGAAAPLAHASNHEPGGSDEISIAGLAHNVIFRAENFTALDKFTKITAGSGSTSYNGISLILNTGSTTGSSIAIKHRTQWSLAGHTYDDIEFINFLGQLLNLSSDVGEYWIITGEINNSNHLGFKVAGGILYGTVANGSAESTLELADWSGAGYNQTVFLSLIVHSSTSVEFFLNNVSIGTITTNIPTGTSPLLSSVHLIAKNLGSTNQIKINADYFSIKTTI